MLDWLNIKAALSVAVIVLIASAGALYEHHEDKLLQQELEALLERFVSVVDRMSASSSVIALEVTSSRADEDGIYMPAALDGEPYEIHLTRSHARFKAGNHQCSKEFLSPVLLTDRDHSTLFISPPMEEEFDGVSFIKMGSGTTIWILKINVISHGLERPAVVISPDTVYPTD